MSCVQSGAFTGGQQQPINLQPFTNLPLIREVSNNTLIMITEENQMWFGRVNSNSWQQAEPGEVEQYCIWGNSKPTGLEEERLLQVVYCTYSHLSH